MFANLTINSKNHFDLTGLLTESLLFYQQTNLILDPGSFPEALSVMGYNNLVELINAGDLSVKLNSQALGVGNPYGNSYMISSWSTKHLDKGRIITESTEQLWGRNIQSNNQKKHLLNIIGEHQYGIDYNQLLYKEVLDTENFIDAIMIVSKGEIQKENIEIEIKRENSGLFYIDSNIENKIIEDAAFLICTGSGLLHDSSVYNSELVTNSTISSYPTSRIQRVIDKRKNTENQIQNFHSFVLPGFYDVKSIVESGAKNFNEFMDLWRVAKKFKLWLKDEEPNVELLTAYIRKISESSWLDKTPIKALRWILFTGAGIAVGDVTGGIAGTAANIALDIFDSFLFEGIVQKKYKPNQFVENEYKDYLNLGI